MKTLSPLYQLRLHRESIAREVAAIEREGETFWGSDTLKDKSPTIHLADMSTVRLKVAKTVKQKARQAF